MKREKDIEVKVDKHVELNGGKLWFQKSTSGGHFYLGNKMIKPGEKFLAYPQDIPEAFKDQVSLIDGESLVSKQVQKAEIKFTLVQAPKNNPEDETEETLYNIVDLKQKQINDEPLPFAEAQELVTALSA